MRVLCSMSNLIVHLLYSLQISHDSTIHCLAWSPETTMAVAPRKLKFATGASDYCVRVFSTDLGQNETLRVLKGHRDYVNAVAFHPQNDGGQIGMVSHKMYFFVKLRGILSQNFTTYDFFFMK